MPAQEPQTISAPLPEAWDKPSSRSRGLLRLIAHVGPDLLLLGLMFLFLALTLTLRGGSIRWAQASVMAPIYMMLFLLVSRLIHRLILFWKKKSYAFTWQKIFIHTLRDWIPFIIIDFIYENLHDLSQVFYTRDFAGTIMAMDMRIFGVELTQWSQRFFHPLLTDYFAITYGIWLILPLVLMYFLSYRNLRPQLKDVILALSIAFCLGFLGYMYIPCSPPRYFLESQYTQPAQLYGQFLFNQMQVRWDHLSVVSAGAFPSLHVGISSVALIFAFRFRKRSGFDRWLFRIYLPLTVSLWAATVYLRHHWFIDIVAGWTLAYFACWISPKINRGWKKFRQSVGLPAYEKL